MTYAVTITNSSMDEPIVFTCHPENSIHEIKLRIAMQLRLYVDDIVLIFSDDVVAGRRSLEELRAADANGDAHVHLKLVLSMQSGIR